MEIMEMLDSMKPNTQWYAFHWCSTGEQHPQEHHFITEKLVKFRKEWALLSPVEQFQVLENAGG